MLGVALGSAPQSFAEDAQDECKEASRPRKRLCLTRSLEAMDPDCARGFAAHSGDAGGGGAVRQSSGDAADGDRAGRRNVLERAKSSAPLPLGRSTADSGDVPGAPLDIGRSTILPARGL